MRKAIVLIACLAASACVEVVDSSRNGIWIQEPLIAFDDPDTVAAEHCAKFGARAERQGAFGGGESYFLPIHAYDCRR